MVKRNCEAGMFTVELIVAMAILVIAILPLAYSFVSEQKIARHVYQRAAIMELIDGEMETLAAGEWRDFKEGTQDYPLRADIIKTLPPGKATLTINGKHLHLEWSPDKKFAHCKIIREADAR